MMQTINYKVVVVVLLSVLLTTGVTGGNVTIAVLGTTPTSAALNLEGAAAAAVPLALDDLPDYMDDTTDESNCVVGFTFQPSNCDATTGLSAFVRTVLVQQATSAMIDCDGPALAAGLLAADWQVPLIGYNTVSPQLSDKSTYSTFVRIVPPYPSINNVLQEVFAYYNWTTAGLLTSTSTGIGASTDSLMYTQKAITSSFDNPFSLFTQTLPANFSTMDIANALTMLSKKSRILILVLNKKDTQAVLMKAAQMGYGATGEYVFITTNLKSLFNDTSSPEITSNSTLIGQLMEVLPYVIHIMFEPNHQEILSSFFLERMVERYTQPPFNATITTAQISPAASYLYDATILYALTVNKMAKSGLDCANGSQFLKFAQQVVFKGITGMVSIDQNGDRRRDFLLYRFPNGTAVATLHFDMLNKNLTLLAKDVWPHDMVPLSTPSCGFMRELCPSNGPGNVKSAPTQTANQLVTPLAATVGVLVFVLLVSGVIKHYKQYLFEFRVYASTWTVDLSQLQDVKGGGSKLFSVQSMDTGAGSMTMSNVCYYKSTMVYVKKLRDRRIDCFCRSKKAVIELKQMKDLNHENINTFIGIANDLTGVTVLWAYCPKGSLFDILRNDDIKLDFNFAISFAEDIAQGMNYLHKSDIKVHGNLKSLNCVINSRWTVKLQGFGPKRLYTVELNKTQEETNLQVDHFDLFWTAPEHLRESPIGSSQKGDVYSYAIILYEIFSRHIPYEDTKLTSEEVVQRLKKETEDPFRPEITFEDAHHHDLLTLLEDCWSEHPVCRPDFPVIIKYLAGNLGKKRNLVDNMVGLLEKYASNLEGLVAQRTRELADEKERADRLLYQMMPRSIAEQLKSGAGVMAENYDSVTIYFSDIVGFTTMSAISTPLQVVAFLNDLYSGFDGIIEHHDVYKVETIGDAYMIVSGLPRRNGLAHAGEIATASLKLLDFAVRFRIRHLPDRRLLLRIGIHSGPCVAGVVGLKMPRYCLFGDTVNTASRMESNGKPWKIHASETTTALLKSLGGYFFEERGYVEMKGKGQVHTYWLTGKTDFTPDIPPLEDIKSP